MTRLRLKILKTKPCSEAQILGQIRECPAPLPPGSMKEGDDRKCVCCSQASLYAIYKHAWPKQSVPDVKKQAQLEEQGTSGFIIAAV